MVCFADSPKAPFTNVYGLGVPHWCLPYGRSLYREPLCLFRVHPSECHISCNIDRRYSTLFAHTGSCARPNPSRNLGFSPCAASLGRLLHTPAGGWPFPTLSPQSLYRRLDPYPAALLRCFRSFLPGQHRPHLSQNRFGALKHPSQ